MTTADDDERPRPEGAGEALSGALEYASAGYLVGPVTIRLLPNGHKQAEFHTSWSAPDGLSCDEDQIKAWARQYPGTGFHAPCSPNGFVVAEGDVKRASEDGRVVSISGVQAWRRAGGPDSPMTVRTRSGGEHWYFAAPETPIYNSANAVEGVPNVDVRGEGGTVFIGGTHVLGPDGKSTGHYAALRVLPPAELPALPVTWARRLREASKSSKASEAGAGELPPGSRLWTPERVHDRAWIEAQVREACTRADELSVANFRHAFFSVAVTLYTAAGCGVIEAAEVDEMLEDAIRRVWNAPPDERDRAHVMAARRRAAVNPWRVGPSPPAGAADEGGDEDSFEDGGGGANEGEPSSWAPVELGPYLDGSYVPPAPEFLERADGHALFYPGRVHWLFGENESGKSWVALIAVARVLLADRIALFVDYESDPGEVTGRLRALGVPVPVIAARLRYVAPEIASEHAASTYRELLSHEYAIAVVDGVTAAMGTEGASILDNDQISTWVRTIPRCIARETGAATVVIDHVVKDKEGRGRFPVGGQQKMNEVTGAAYMVEPESPVMKGAVGELVLWVAKDRPSGVRPWCGEWHKNTRMQEAARVQFDATNPDALTVTVNAPAGVGDEAASGIAGEKKPAFQPTVIMQRISEWMQFTDGEVSKATIEKNVTGKAEIKRYALDELTKLGYVTRREGGPRGALMFTFVKRYSSLLDQDHYGPDGPPGPPDD